MDICLKILTALGQIATAIIAIWTIKLWHEAKKQRIASQKPLLIPYYISLRSNNLGGSLFVGNFGYPMTGKFQFNGLVYVGIKNIGYGPSLNTKVELFKTDKDAGIELVPEFIDIPNGEFIPMVIRFGYNSEDDLEFKSHIVIIKYQDSFENSYYLQIELWFRNLKENNVAEAIVIRYKDTPDLYSETPIVVHRYMEMKGYFEMKNINKKNDI